MKYPPEGVNTPVSFASGYFKKTQVTRWMSHCVTGRQLRSKYVDNKTGVVITQR